MAQIRKQYSAIFKAQVVQEAMAGEKTLNQIAAEHGIHPNLITKWRRAALTAMPNAFDEEGKATKQIAALQAQHEREKEALYAEIGRLTTQVNWLQKKITAASGIAHPPRPDRPRQP
jgi:transposase-like protein